MCPERVLPLWFKTHMEHAHNEIITDGIALATADGKVEVDYSETTDQKVSLHTIPQPLHL